MGDVRPYEASEQMCKQEPLDLATYPLAMVELEITPGKSGWAKYRVKLPTKIRTLYLDCPRLRNDWQNLVKDFDDRPLVQPFIACGRRENYRLRKARKLVDQSIGMTSYYDSWPLIQNVFVGCGMS